MTPAEAEVLDEFVADLHGALAPVGPLETVLTDKLISLAWRLRRIGRLETELLHVESIGTGLPHLRLGVAFARSCVGGDSFAKLGKYEAGLDRAYFRTLHELQRAQERRLGRPSPPPVAVDVTLEAP
jgi:hypothetical protein